jgi:RNA polymerase sigma-70 factor (ECF subfamily)
MSRSLEEFDRLFRDDYRPIFTFFRNSGYSPEEAEELAQETFLQAYKSWKHFRGDSTAKTWLFGIAKNIWCNDLRAQGRLKRTSTDEVPLEVLEDEGSPKVPTTDTEGQPSPQDDALAAERARSVRAAVGELPEMQRRALFLQLDQGLKYREIAEVLHEPMERVKSWLYQARQKIKGILERQFGPDGY